MSDRDIAIIYENTVLLKEYSEGFTKQQIARLKPQAGAFVEEDGIRAMIGRFNQLKSGQAKNQIIDLVKTNIENGTIAAANDHPKEVQRIQKLASNPLMIEFYSWHDLEVIVHSFRDPAEKQAIKAAKKNADQTGASLIYEGNGLRVYFGANKQECQIFKNYLVNTNKDALKAGGVDVNASSGSIYGWCISYAGPNNLFDSYRFRSETSASVYFIVDDGRPVTDPLNVIVLHAQKDGNFRLTNAYNRSMGGYSEEVGDWNKVLKWQPKLKGHESLFKFVPFSESEQLHLVTKNAGPKDFPGFTAFNVKRAYIDSQKKIFAKDFLELPADLQHAYVNVRAPDAADANLQTRLRKLLYLFADPEYQKIEDRMNRAAEEGDRGNENWIEVLYDDDVMKKCKKVQTYKYWCKLIDDTLNEMGAAKAANERNG